MHHSIVTRHLLRVTACDLEVQLAQCAMMRQTPKIRRKKINDIVDQGAIDALDVVYFELEVFGGFLERIVLDAAPHRTLVGAF